MPYEEIEIDEDIVDSQEEDGRAEAEEARQEQANMQSYDQMQAQEPDHESEKIVIEQLDQANNSIDQIMDKLSLTHSISKIG